jgi:hypothetical protein
MIRNVQSNTAEFFIINVNQKVNMFRRFLDRHHQAFYQTISILKYNANGIPLCIILKNTLLTVTRNQIKYKT